MAWVQVQGYQQGEGDWVPGYWVDHATGQVSATDPNAPPPVNLYGWDPNMAMPEGGFTVGQALAPNYLSQGYVFKDDADLRRALADVAPGYQQPATIDMNAQIAPSQMRAPAKDNGFESLLGMGAMAGLGYLSGGFGLGDLFSNLTSGFGESAFSVAEGGMPTQVGGWYGEAPTFSGTFDPSLPYNAVSANDPIGALIQNLESGMTPSQAVSAVEAAIPGTTRSALEQFLYEAGTGASSLGGKIASGLGSIFGGQEGLASKGGSDLLSMLGKIAPSLLGMYASNQQSEKLSELAQKYQDFGAPYRSKLAEISANPDAFYNSTAAQQGVNAVLNKLSIGGNPSGSPYKQQLAVDSLWNDYGRERDRLAGFGGLTNYNAAAPNLEAQAVGSNANMYNALGAGLNDIFNPKTSLADLLKQGKLA